MSSPLSPVMVTLIIALVGWLISALAVAVKAGGAIKTLELVMTAVHELTAEMRLHIRETQTSLATVFAQLARGTERLDNLERRTDNLEDALFPPKGKP